MIVKLMLVTEAGEVLDSTEVDAADFNAFRNSSGPGASLLLGELAAVDLEPVDPVAERNLADMPRSATF